MEIQEIKERLGIIQVLAHYGLEVKKGHVCCPFHDDKNPSMKVYPDSNTVYCFSGNCRLGGQSLDVIDFVMEKEETGKHRAIMKCKELLGYIPESKQQVDVMKLLWTNFVVSFKNVRCKARAYAQSRGLSLEGLGYNVGSWHRRKERTKEELQAASEVGYILPTTFNKGHRAWGKNCLIFPLKNEFGQVVSFYGRAVNPVNTGQVVAGHYYMKNRKGLYPGHPKSDTKKIILTESVIDAASLLQAKRLTESYEVLALYGTNGYTGEHKRALQQVKELEELVLMLDGDEAGRKASEKLAVQLQKDLPKTIIKIVSLPEGTDVNELWVNHLSEDLFLELLASAVVANEPEQENPSLDLKVVNPNYYVYDQEDIKIEVLGGISLEQIDRMQCTLRVTRKPQRNALDKVRQNLNLYHAGQVKGLVSRLHEQLELPIQSLRLSLANLTEQLEEYRANEQTLGEAQKEEKRQIPAVRRKKALEYLKAADLMEQTWTDISQVGIVGERENALIMYLCFSSRKLSKPLHVISLGSSGSGKTHLQESIASLMPEEELVSVTSLSDQALYYYPEGSLVHKLFLVEDLDGMGEDAQFAMRELKSKGVLTKDLPIKNQSGKPETIKVQVKGPICFAGCTTRQRVYEDNANRCLLLYRDESKAHKEAVMAEQRRAAAGKVNELQQQQLKEQFKDLQTLLQPIRVVNPYAEALALPPRIFKPLRTNAHYLQFIEVITFYHQYQRERKTSQSGKEYIETTLEDIEWANKLMKKVLLAKSDELSWGVRNFLERLKGWLQTEEKESFKSQQVRNAFRMSPSTLKKYLRILLQYGRVEIIGGSKYKGLEYGLLQEDDYEELKEGLETALDKALSEIKLKTVDM